MPPAWKEFFDQNDSTYNFQDHLYEIHNGLDCSGFLGWALYNSLESENNQSGYVVNASQFGTFLQDKGWGTIIPADQITDYKPGDILFNKGHVYILLGRYDDGSLLILHSSPPGVQVSGTAVQSGSTDSQAAQAASQIMSTAAPDFYSRYGSRVLDVSYLTGYDQFRWNSTAFHDAEQVQQMSIDQIVAVLVPSLETENQTGI